MRVRRDSKELIAELKAQDIWIRDDSRGVLMGWIHVSTVDIDRMKRFWEAYRKVDNVF